MAIEWVTIASYSTFIMWAFAFLVWIVNQAQKHGLFQFVRKETIEALVWLLIVCGLCGSLWQTYYTSRGRQQPLALR